MLSNKLSSLTLRTKMLMFFGGGATIILILIQLTHIFGLPILGYVGEYNQQLKRIKAETRAIAENNETLISLWFKERLGDIQVLSNHQLIIDTLKRPVHSTGLSDNQTTKKSLPIEGAKTPIHIPSELLKHLEQIRTAYGVYDVIDIVERETEKTIVSTNKARNNTPHALAKEIFVPGSSMDRVKIVFKTLGEDAPAVLFITAPIHVGTSLIPVGAIVLEISTDILFEQKYLAEQSMTDTGEIILIDMQKRLLTQLAHPLPDGSYAKPLRYTLTTKAADFAAWGVNSLIETVDYRGVGVLSAVRHIRLTEDFAISMIVNRNKSDLYFPVWKNLLIFVVISVAGVGAAMVFVVFAARQLASPLEYLTKVSNLIHNGDLSARVPKLKGLEAGSLARAFNTMADSMEHAQSTLQEQVESRTEELRRSEERSRILLENIPDLVWLKDIDGVFLGCNSAFERLFGAKDREIVGKTDYDFEDRKIADFSRMQDQKAIRAGAPITYEQWITFAGKSQKSLFCTTKTPIYEKSGEFIGVLGVGRDITEIRKNEVENRKLIEQLQQAQKIESVGRLAGGVAHDFNNMLSVIIGHAELALTQLAPEAPTYSDIQSIKGAADRSAALTRQLLAFARKQEISPQILNLNSCVEGMLSIIRRLIGENVNLDWEPSREPSIVRIDPTQIEQVLTNLCINAKDAIIDTGNITINTGLFYLEENNRSEYQELSPGTYITLTVTDNGTGISEEVQKNIFEPFFTTKGLGKGTGLGLSTVYGVVKQNHGAIEVESVVDKGTAFTIYLPMCHPDEGKVITEEMVQLKAHGDESILIIEDEAQLLEMSTRMLANAGYKVHGVTTPEQAIDYVQNYKDELQLVITDVIMPEMNGKDLASKLLTIIPGCKCLFMSGYTADVIGKHGVLEENVHFIHKPFSTKELTHKVREILDKTTLARDSL